MSEPNFNQIYHCQLSSAWVARYSQVIYYMFKSFVWLNPSVQWNQRLLACFTSSLPDTRWLSIISRRARCSEAALTLEGCRVLVNPTLWWPCIRTTPSASATFWLWAGSCTALTHPGNTPCTNYSESFVSMGCYVFIDIWRVHVTSQINVWCGNINTILFPIDAQYASAMDWVQVY